MSLTAAELRAVYSVDERPLDRSLSGLGGKVRGAIGGAVGAAAGLFAFSQISQGFMGLTGAASDLQGTISKSGAIFGANAAAIDQWAKGAAANLGLSRQQAMAAAAGFGDMFSQIGFAGDQAADMSQAVVQMSADLGAFNDLPTEDVAQRISAAFRGEYDSLQALIPNINAARVESEAMAATGKTVASELTAQEKAAAVLAIVNKDGARAVGAFARESDSAAGAAKIATAQWNDQKAVIGARLLPAFTALMGFLSGTVIPGVGKLASFIADDAIPAIKSMAEWVDANRTPLLVVAGILAAVFLPHLIAVAYQSVLTRTALAAMWLASKVGAIQAAVVHSAQIALMIARFVALGVVAVAQGVIVAAVWTAQIAASAVAGAASFVAQVARVVAGWVLMAATAVAQAALVVGGWVLMGAQSLIQAARMAAAWLIAMGPVGWVIAAVVGLVALIVANWDKVRTWTVNAWNAVVGAVTGAWDRVTGAVSSGIDSAVSFVRGLPGRILGALGNFGSLLWNAGRDMIQGLINGAGSLLRNIGRFFLNLVPGWIRGPFEAALGISSPSKVFAGYGANIGEGLIRGLHGMRPAVAAEMQRLADTQALGSLTARRPAGATVTRPGSGPDGPGAADGGGGGGRGALFHADTVNVIEGTPRDVARQLELGARTRGRY